MEEELRRERKRPKKERQEVEQQIKQAIQFEQRLATEHHNLTAQQQKVSKAQEILKAEQARWEQQKRAEQQSLTDQQNRTGQRARDEQQARGQTIVTTRIGEIKEFNMTEGWELWTQRLQQFFLANDVTEVRKDSLFLTLLGSEGYALLRNLCTPDLPSSKSFETLLTLMKEHLQPKPSVIMERYKFKECRQKDSENIRQFVTNLKKLSTYCEFGTNLNYHVRDQFVWGLRSDAIKQKLLGEKDLSCSRAIEFAQAMESATRDAAEMGLSTQKSTESINFWNSKKQQQTKGQERNQENLVCGCCGGRYHRASACRYKKFKCNICKKEGHLSRVYKNRKNCKSRDNNVNGNKLQSRNRQNFLTEENSENNDFDELFHLGESDKMINNNDKNKSEPPYVIKIEILGEKIDFIVDIGSDVTAVSEEFVKERKSFQSVALEKTQRRFKSHPGHKIVPLGSIEVEAKYRNKNSKLALYVLPGNSPPILGRSWMRVFSIELSEKENHKVLIG